MPKAARGSTPRADEAIIKVTPARLVAPDAAKAAGGEGRQRSRRDFERTPGRGHDGHRGGAGKGNWGKAGDELAELGANTVDESETEPEVVDNSSELTFAQAEALKAEKRAALAAQWKRPEAKVLDGSALEGLKLMSGDADDADLDFGGVGVKGKRDRTKNAASKQKVDVGFRIASTQPADDRDDRDDSSRRSRRSRRSRLWPWRSRWPRLRPRWPWRKLSRWPWRWWTWSQHQN